MGMDWLIFIVIGAIAGLVMGALGVGGGAIIIFGLLYFAQFAQKMAQGTTLLVIAAPVSLLAAYNYYRNGFVDVKAGLLVMAAFLLFSFIGSQFAIMLPKEILKTGMGVIFIFMGVKMLFS